MTNITGNTANALRVNIHRICVKLNLATREELTNTLNGVLSQLSNPVTPFAQ